MKRTPHLLAIQSHVVFGHAGNSAAVFPMQRIGVNVWPLNTVQFSNHTQYKQWTGEVLAPQQIPALIDGIAAIGELGNCDAVLSGYLGSAAQGRAILTGVARIKAANPKALYLCDPVMGHPEKGCIVAPEVSDFLLQEAAAMADFMCPNQLELDSFSGRKPESLHDCLAMARALLARGPKAIVVKHLDYPGKAADGLKCCWSLPRPAGICAARYWHFRVSRSAWGSDLRVVSVACAARRRSGCSVRVRCGRRPRGAAGNPGLWQL